MKKKIKIVNEYKYLDPICRNNVYNCGLNFYILSNNDYSKNILKYYMLSIWLQKNRLHNFTNVYMYISKTFLEKYKELFNINVDIDIRYKNNYNYISSSDITSTISSYNKKIIIHYDCDFLFYRRWVRDKSDIVRSNIIMDCYNENDKHYIYYSDCAEMTKMIGNEIEYSNDFIIEYNYYNESDYIMFLNKKNNDIIYLNQLYTLHSIWN